MSYYVKHYPSGYKHLLFKIENEIDFAWSRGGRLSSDIKQDANGRYLEMTTFDKTNKLYIPTVFK